MINTDVAGASSTPVFSYSICTVRCSNCILELWVNDSTHGRRAGGRSAPRVRHLGHNGHFHPSPHFLPSSLSLPPHLRDGSWSVRLPWNSIWSQWAFNFVEVAHIKIRVWWEREDFRGRGSRVCTHTDTHTPGLLGLLGMHYHKHLHIYKFVILSAQTQPSLFTDTSTNQLSVF